MDEYEIQNAIEKRMSTDKKYNHKMQKAVEEDNTNEIINLIYKVWEVVPVIAEIIAWIIKLFKKR